MTDSVFTMIGRFLKHMGKAAGTPSGDPRGHVRAYPYPTPLQREHM